MSSKLLEGKVGVVIGVANKRSIAFAIAKAWHEAGAKLIFNYQGERLKDGVLKLVHENFGEDVPVYDLDAVSYTHLLSEGLPDFPPLNQSLLCKSSTENR